MTIESIIEELDKLIANCEQSKRNLNDAMELIKLEATIKTTNDLINKIEGK